MAKDFLQDKRVKIGAMRYRIEVVEALTSENGTLLWGDCNSGKQRIRIDAEPKGDFQRGVVLHEIVHAIFENSGQGEANNSENVVNAVAYGVLALLKENPWLVKWLLKPEQI